MKVLIGQTDGLPNITGKSIMCRTDIWPTPSNINGAFYQTNGELDASIIVPMAPTSIQGQGLVYHFDASRSNPIYGNSTYVRTKNISLKTWLRIS